MPAISNKSRTTAAQQTQASQTANKPAPQKPTPATSSSGWVKPAGSGGGSSIPSEQARKSFWHSPYTNADAKAVQKHFGLKSVDAGKEMIGRAVITRNERSLEAAGVTRARYDDHDCMVAFKRSQYTDSDAKQALKELPFLKNLNEAKEYIGLKVVNKTESILHEVGVTPSQYDSHEMMDAFKRSGFSAADVEKAKKSFDFLKDSSTKDVKEYLGLKVLNNYTEMMAEKGITPGRDRHEIP